MTKPHNMYLQIGVKTGVILLIAILVFYFCYFFYEPGTCFRLKKYDLMAFVGRRARGLRRLHGGPDNQRLFDHGGSGVLDYDRRGAGGV